MISETEAARALDPRGQGLAPRHAVAIAVAMALMTRPGDLVDEEVAAARATFGEAELLELTLDTMKWNAQKATVALGVDVEVRPGELTDLVFDADGNWVRPR